MALNGLWVTGMKLNTYPKIQFFIWLSILNKLLTKELLIRRGVNISPNCAVCQTGIDSTAHILRECSFAMNLWNQSRIPSDCYHSFDCDFVDWLKMNLTSKQLSCNVVIP